jgi:hypothetical protein
MKRIRPDPSQVGAVGINLEDDEVDFVKKGYKKELKRGKIILIGNELWVWDRDKRKYMNELGIQSS